jgi:AcrR family transcriptional regulator
MTHETHIKALYEAAFRLAERQSWREVTLSAIAAEAGLSLADMARESIGKMDILRAFSRDIDLQLLQSLDSDPLDGEPHDRLFDIMLRRIELLTPHRTALKSIAAAPADGPSEFLALLATAMDTQGWLLAAAGLETPGARGELHRLGLAKIYADTLRVWLDDDDPGMARTMATLDRKLRDGEAWLKRLEIPLAMCKGFAGAIRAYRETRNARSTPPATSQATDATAD